MRSSGAQEIIPDARESSLKRHEVVGAKDTLRVLRALVDWLPLDLILPKQY